MDKFTVNSREYWDNRFDTDWKDFNGNEQTAYFASLLNDMLPSWLINEVNEKEYEICDLGCAEGDALTVYRQTFLKSKLHGEDFSEAAINQAKEKYPQYDFKVSNIMAPENEKQYPVIICSNVIEHFKETYSVIEKICERVEKYAIIMFPYREELGAIKEHERIFHTKDIPVRVNNNYLIYAKTVECNSPLYPFEQIILVYAKDKRFYLLSEIVEGVNSDCAKLREEELKGQVEGLKRRLEEADNALLESQEEIEKYKRRIAEWQEKVTKEKNFSEKENSEIILKHEAALKQYRETIVTHEQMLNRVQQELTVVSSLLKQKDEYIRQTQELCQHYATGKLMKLNHFMYRLKLQYLDGSREDKKAFRLWLKGKRNKTNRNIGEGVKYNPWMIVNEKLKEALTCTNTATFTDIETSASGIGSALSVVESNTGSTYILPEITKKILKQNYKQYDVIILSVIDYNFRHQRPQHFASRFAANGHRVYYVNANFVRSYSVMEKQENLFIVDFSSTEHNAIYSMEGPSSLEWLKENLTKLIDEQAVRDAIVIVDYPNWVYGAEYLRAQYGFKIVTDYMDDYTGFLGTAEDFLKDNCIMLLKESDLVVASSQFLYEVACQHIEKDKVIIVRNGTEVEHFYQAVGMEAQDKQKKVIGYYGAIAHWFAWEKVCYLAEKFPECEIIIVGEVTEYRDKLEKYSNIKLLGEKLYSELPEYLANFDVCLIPFDTSTDLIKATNPVKFYEYLSAGKKIVATEIPELMPYKDKYVYMSNDNEKFAEYVKLCLEGKDCLESKEECISFAKENDWRKRYEQFEEGCILAIPKVSIIVLTYNNLQFNKQCIDSIISKTAYANYELIIVDNCSNDGTVEYLKKLNQSNNPGIKVILNQENAGFAGGNNIGIKEAKGDYILLLNNDTVVTRGWLTAIVKHLENNRSLGMCNPVTNSIGNESKIVVEYNNRVRLEEFAYSYTCKHMGEEFQDVDRLPLFATIIRKEIIDKVGVLDEQYKIGMFEDDDYTERVLQAGYGITIAEDSFVHHINNGSFKKLEDEEYREIFNANKRKFEKKWNKKWTMPKYREGVTADCNSECCIDTMEASQN